MLRVGLIGCGGIGAVHAQCWLALMETAQLVAVADLSEDRTRKYAQESGCRTYRDGKELLEKESLDVVDICVPTFLHAEYVLAAMERVKNIIVEKPVCLTEEEARTLTEAEKRTGALVQVAHVVRFSDSYKYLKELVKSGVYGKIIAGDFARFSPRPLWMAGHDDLNRTGGMALDMHIHDVDYIRYLMEREPDKVRSSSVKDPLGVIQHIWTAYQYGDTVLVAEGSWNYPSGMPFAQTFRVRLEKAAVILEESGVLKVYPEEGGVVIPELGKREEMDMGINVSDMGPYLNEIKYFAETILAGNYHGIARLSEAIASLQLVRRELQ